MEVPKTTETVIAPSSSFPLTSAMVRVAPSSLVMVTKAVSVISTPKVVDARLSKLIDTFSSDSTATSAVGVSVKVWDSPAVPAKVKVSETTAV